MNQLVAKEIRLLRPAFGSAIAVAFISGGLLGIRSSGLFLYFGVLLLSLSCFGREFALKTFALQLAQPISRERLWWTKIVVLALAILAVFVIWCLPSVTQPYMSLKLNGFMGAAGFAVCMVIVIFVGALWSTLLLRSMIAAFWFAILIPGALLMAISVLGGGEKAFLAVMSLYAIAGFFWARLLFLRATDSEWTGGEVNVPLGKESAVSAASLRRRSRPLIALLRKEFRLQQFSLAAIAGLFLLHLAVVALRKLGVHAQRETFEFHVVEFAKIFPGFWLLVPLIVGGVSVAEERKLGTMQQMLCLPASFRTQFLIKLGVVFFIGGILCPGLLLTAEGIGSAAGADAGVEFLKNPLDPATALWVPLLFMAISLVGFYASTLVRNILHALAAGVVVSMFVLMFQWVLSHFDLWLLNWGRPFPFWMWQGQLGMYLGWPALVLMFTWLSYRNFPSLVESGKFWRRNLLALSTVAVFIVALTSLIFHRAWEFLLPLEGTHGVARIAAPRTSVLKVFGGLSMTATLPNDEFWVDRALYFPGRAWLRFREDSVIYTGGKWNSLSGVELLKGANWVDAAATFRETIAIQANGTLWASEKPRKGWEWDNRPPPFEKAARLTRFGDGTNWLKVIVEESHSVVLLRRDGSLWRWGDPNFDDKEKWTGFHSAELRPLGGESGWGHIATKSGCVLAWKSNGAAWLLYDRNTKITNGVSGRKHETITERCSLFDNKIWQSISEYMELGRFGVASDGTLWFWPRAETTIPERWSGKPDRLDQVGTETNWVSVAGWGRELVGLKRDGSLWKWEFSRGLKPNDRDLSAPPARLGKHSDWVGLGEGYYGVYALSADGNLWYWWYTLATQGGLSYSQPLLAPPRRPSKIENIFPARQLRGRE